MSTASKAQSFPHGHMLELDGVRGTAVLLVLTFHAWTNIVPLGWTGVELFFVLSGFLITGILLDERSKAPTARRYFGVFYLKRSLRIFPIYYLCVGATFVLALRMGWPHSDVPWYLGYLQNFKINWAPNPATAAFPGFMNHTWSLAVEEQFYVVWPWMVLLLGRRQLAWVCAAFLIGAPIFRAAATALYPATEFNYILLPSQIDALGAGALLAIVAREVPLSVLKRAALWFAAACGVALAVFFAFPGNAPLRQDLLPYLCVACVGLPIVFPKTVFAAACRLGPLRYAGRVSYGLYLYHPIVFHLTSAAFLRRPAVYERIGQTGETLIAVGLSGAIAAASWHLFESPLNDLKRRLA